MFWRQQICQKHLGIILLNWECALRFRYTVRIILALLRHFLNDNNKGIISLNSVLGLYRKPVFFVILQLVQARSRWQPYPDEALKSTQTLVEFVLNLPYLSYAEFKWFKSYQTLLGIERLNLRRVWSLNSAWVLWKLNLLINKVSCFGLKIIFVLSNYSIKLNSIYQYKCQSLIAEWLEQWLGKAKVLSSNPFSSMPIFCHLVLPCVLLVLT